MKLVKIIDEQKANILKLEADSRSSEKVNSHLTSESYFSKVHKLEPIRKKTKTNSIKEDNLLNKN